ncbi:hypothetical protein QQS21_012717 [Conoideocrella luteorostrata]|uniref:Rhodopsin domain-containing protein n=1 Tax=Conoideocrella luteorostrata TaxID=1105319 RepID=A0AAJ0CCZ9_9HYPO|nr:hypothetical protein QQS21_012717 [Conoideocrella luteorostrata]
MRLALVSDRVGLIIMTVILCVLVILSLYCRLKARKLTTAGLEIDDWLAVVSLVFTLGINGIFLAGTIDGAITGHSNIVNGISVTNDLEILTQKYKYAYQTSEKIAFGLIKLSILFLWKRLFGRSKALTILCYVMIGVIVAWTIAFFFETVFQCGSNWPMNWAPIFVFLAECTASLDVLTVFGVSDVVTDLIILAMPIPLIWSLRMPRKKKVAVTGIFALGFFTIASGVARLFYYLATSYNHVENPDFIGDVTLTLLWSTIELNVAMIVCSLPVLSPIFEKFRSNLVSLSGRLGIAKWTNISNERSDRKGSNQISDILRAENGAARKEGQGFSTHRHNYMWPGGHGAVSSAGFFGIQDSPDHSRGILARTEISTTIEENKPRRI